MATVSSSDFLASVLWCALPELNDQMLLPATSSVRRSFLRAHVVPRPVGLTRWSAVGYRGGMMAWVDGTSPQRALNGIIQRQDRASRVERALLPHSVTETSAEHNAVKRLRSIGTEFLRDQGRLDLLATWFHRIEAASLELRRFREFDWRQYRFLLVAQYHDVAARAMLLTSEAQGVPVVLIPEAPLTRAGTRDVPVPYAGYRGLREVQIVATAAGGDDSRLAVVGNTMTDVLGTRPPVIHQDSPGVLALSAYEITVIEEMFGRLVAAGLDQLTVAPHPRTDTARVRKILPSGWTWFEGRRTLDLLRTGPKFVIQTSSGIAWEAAALGIPTADLHMQGIGRAQNQYPFLDDTGLIPPLESVQDVRAFVDSVSRGEADRDAIRARAESWCEVDGDASADRVDSLLDSVERDLWPSRIIDGWAPGGPAWLTSTVAQATAI